MTTGFPTAKPDKRFQRLLDLALLWVQVDGDEIQFGGDLLGYETRGQAGAVQAPGHEAHGDQVPLVVLADGRHQLVTPLAGDFGPRPIFLIQRDELDEITGSLPKKDGPSQSPGFLVPPGTTGSFIRS